MSTRQWITAVAFSTKKQKQSGREGNEYIVLKGNRKSKGVHKWTNCHTVTVNDCVHLSPCCTSTGSILSLITTNTCTWLPQPKDRRTRHSSVPASARCLLLRVGGERENLNFLKLKIINCINYTQWLLRAATLHLIYFYFDYSYSLEYTYYMNLE